MADKPALDPLAASLRDACSQDLTGPSGLTSEVEIRLRSTERVKVVLQRCERTNAPHHLLMRIRETLISITTSTRDRTPPRSH
jgi:hypothetical protein